MGCHFLLQAIFPTKGSNLGLLHCRKMLYPLSYYVVGLKYITKSRDVLSWSPQQKISKEFTRIPLSSFYKWRNEGTGKFVDWVIPIKLVNTRIDLLLLLSWLVVVNVKVADILNLHAILPCLTILLAWVLSHVWLFASPWPGAHQAPLSMEFSRQEFWSGLPFPTPQRSSWPRDQTCVSWVTCIGRQILYHWTNWEPVAYPLYSTWRPKHVQTGILAKAQCS